MKRFFSDPLAGFAAAAAGVFLLFAALPRERSDPARTIEITGKDIDRLKASFQVVWLRPPDERELQNLIEERVRDEIFYREALLMGLDRDDTVVRRRMRQALELMASGIAGEAEPTEGDLEDHLRKNPDVYRRESTVSFRQIYFSPVKRGDAAASDASKLLEGLQSRADTTAAELGDGTLLPEQWIDTPVSEVAAQLGQAFSEALARFPQGQWTGPIESPYGIHLVLVEGRREGGIPPLAEVRDRVRRDWMAARAGSAEAEFFASLLSRYTAVFESEEPGSR
jgi:hypothetical protein